MARKLRFLLAVALGALAVTGTAQARGGNYVFDGGTRSEQTQVVSALNASAFDWSLVPAQITIHIAPGIESEANRGEIWLDAKLLDQGVRSWGFVQHEYAHQIDFFLLTDALRDQLLGSLGGQVWDYSIVGLPHFQYGCERFASTLAWSFWPSKRNALNPALNFENSVEAGAMAPPKFRALLTRLLGAP